MFIAPTSREITECAAGLGLHIEDDEVPSFRRVVSEQLQRFHEFLETPFEEDRPPLLYPERAPGMPPGPEDVHRAWLWKCSIGGAAGMLKDTTVSFKDHISVAGIPQRFSSLALEHFIPDVDAAVVTRVLAAGGRVVGKNRMSGFAGDYEMPSNPHDSEHVSGGSSAGSAVAVAAGDVDVSFGGDQGGSIRIPAAYCGVVGLKPTFGLISHFGAGFGAEQSVDHVGPMARRVDQVATALQAVAGFDARDGRQDRSIPESYDALTSLADGVKGLRIGLLQEGFDEPIDPEVANRVREAVNVLAAAGAIVENLSVPTHRRLSDVFAALTLEGAKAVLDTTFYGAGAKTYYPVAAITAIDSMWQLYADMFPQSTKCNHIISALSKRRYHGAVYAKAHNVRPGIVKAYDEALDRVDMLAMPTVRQTAPLMSATIGNNLDGPGETSPWRNWIYMPHTYNTKPFNYTGHPALSVPCGKVGGLPVGLQLVGRSLRDDLLLRAAYTYQESVDWDALNKVGR